MHAARTASPHPVCRVAFSPCGGWLAAAQPHHGITLHDRATGEVVRRFGNARRPDYTGLTFYRGAECVAAAGSWGMIVHAAATGAAVACYGPRALPGLGLGARGAALLGGGPYAVLALEFEPGGPILNRPVWQQDGICHPQIDPAGRWAVGFRPDGNPVAIDLRAGRAALALRHPPSAARRAGRRGLPTVSATCDYDSDLPGLTARWAAHLPLVAFATDRVAYCDWDGVSVFDLTPAPPASPDADAIPAPLPVASPVFTLPPPDGWPAGEPWRPPLALTPDGRGLLVRRPKQRVQLWDVDGGALVVEWNWRLEGITCLAVAPDGLTAVAGGRFGRVLTWDLE